MSYSQENKQSVHVPVLLQPMIDVMFNGDGVSYIDATVGGGGHLMALLEVIESGTVLAIDRDSKAIARVSERLLSENFTKDGVTFTKGNHKVILEHADFGQIYSLVKKHNITNIMGIMADLGMSSDQIDADQRGFSFLRDEDLDMRMNPEGQTVTAADLLNGMYKAELTRILKQYGGVIEANKMANKIIEQRTIEPIKTAKQLSRIIASVVPFNKRTGPNKHPDAKVFQALRIAVNDEVNQLKTLLASGFDILQSGGVMAIITFHSGEDRIVKSYFEKKQRSSHATALASVKPNASEIAKNSRSRSAKLRALAKE